MGYALRVYFPGTSVEPVEFSHDADPGVTVGTVGAAAQQLGCRIDLEGDSEWVGMTKEYLEDAGVDVTVLPS